MQWESAPDFFLKVTAHALKVVPAFQPCEEFPRIGPNDFGKGIRPAGQCHRLLLKGGRSNDPPQEARHEGTQKDGHPARARAGGELPRLSGWRAGSQRSWTRGGLGESDVHEPQRARKDQAVLCARRRRTHKPPVGRARPRGAEECSERATARVPAAAAQRRNPQAERRYWARRRRDGRLDRTETDVYALQ